MGADARTRRKIFENVLGRVGLAGDVLGEYAKALSAMNGMDSMAEVNIPPMPATSTPTMAQTPPSDTQMPPEQTMPPTV